MRFCKCLIRRFLCSDNVRANALLWHALIKHTQALPWANTMKCVQSPSVYREWLLVSRVLTTVRAEISQRLIKRKRAVNRGKTPLTCVSTALKPAVVNRLVVIIEYLQKVYTSWDMTWILSKTSLNKIWQFFYNY